jgi:hypothetical protein
MYKLKHSKIQRKNFSTFIKIGESDAHLLHVYKHCVEFVDYWLDTIRVTDYMNFIIFVKFIHERRCTSSIDYKNSATFK